MSVEAVAAILDDAVETVSDLELAFLPRNDYGNGQRLIKRHGNDLMYVPAIGWHVWDGTRYALDANEFEARRKAHHTALALKDEQKALEDHGANAGSISAFSKFKSSCGNIGKTNAMLGQAKPYLFTDANAINPYPFLFNCLNATLQLPDKPQANDCSEIIALPHSHKHKNTLRAEVAYDPDARAPLFQAFLDTILPSRDVQSFIKRWFGYCCIGGNPEQVMVICFGGGRNGKSTLVETIRAIMGSYTASIPVQALMHDDKRRGGEATPHLMKLPGARLVTAAEFDIGARLSESLVKTITGGEEIMVRGLFEGVLQFVPQFKVMVSTNNKPKIIGLDEGIWRRIAMVPFTVTIPREDVDPNMGKKLLDEASGILNWILEGYLEWIAGGLCIPDEVKAATDEFRAESDPIGEFMRACVVIDPAEKIRSTPLFEVYEAWCHDNGMQPRKITAFGKRLPELGYQRSETSGYREYIGIRLNEIGRDIQNRIDLERSKRTRFYNSAGDD